MTALSLRDFKTSIRYFDKILLLDSGNVEAKAEEAAIHQFMNGEISDTAY